ncbi:hypothetical protein [Burkholderia anthina]|uniref:Uncharacterized protein n=1 Tax=Burkholderia anthina TaxID=179879 RepID=A0ABS2BA59_9BURK|nr:hypothetical protein [Burkholderia anthina]MBM2769859.1 hypothetical protein [Burkholderia anthina]
MIDAPGNRRANFAGWRMEIEASKRLPLQRASRAEHGRIDMQAHTVGRMVAKRKAAA